MKLTLSRRSATRLTLLALAFTLASCAGVAGAAKKAPALKRVALNETDAGEFANFGQWREVGEFIDHMVNDNGFDRASLEATLRQARYVESAIQLMKPAPPGRPKNWQAYRPRFVEPVRIDAGIDPFSLLGSYAGAIGWPQFMPGSIRKYAVDFDGNGRIDLRNSQVDAIGSVANFLRQHGWTADEPTVFPVSVAPDNMNWTSFLGQGLEAKFGLDEVKAAGIIPAVEPPADLKYGLVDLQNGTEPTEYWLGTNNFFAITQYNRSFFYAMSVIDLGRAVRNARTP